MTLAGKLLVHKQRATDDYAVACQRVGVLGYRERQVCRTGFTLIELMVVMAIVAVLASVGTVYGGKYVARRQLEGAAFDVVQKLRQVQAIAVFTRSYLRVSFDVPSGTYSVQTSPGSAAVVTRMSGSVGYASSVLGSSFVPDSVHITSSMRSTSASPAVCTFYFGPMGTPLVQDVAGSTYPPTVPTVTADAQGISVVLATRTGDLIDIRVSSVLGHASMEWK